MSDQLEFDHDGELARLEATAQRPGPTLDTRADPGTGPDLDYVMVLSSVLTPLAAVVVPAWQLSEVEIKHLSEAYALLLEKYFPDLSRFGPEIGAAIVTLAILGPRIAMRIPRTLPQPSNSESSVTANEAKEPTTKTD